MKKMILLPIVFILCFCIASCADSTTSTTPITITNNLSISNNTPSTNTDVLKITAIINGISDDGCPYSYITADNAGFERLYINPGKLPKLDFTPEAGQLVEIEVLSQSIEVTDPKVVEATAENIILIQNSGISVQYIRTNGNDDDREKTAVIESKNQLNEYYLANRHDDSIDNFMNDKYSFDYAHDDTKSFKDAISKYDDNYFKDKLLVFAVLVEGSGSHRHVVKNIDFDSSGNTIYIKRITAGNGTADMASWHIIIEINRKDCSNNTFELNIET